MVKKIVVVTVQRQLGSLYTGANVYLSVLMNTLSKAGFRIHLVFAAESAFGERPISIIGPDFLTRAARISWPGTIRIGRLFISLRCRVWARFLNRLQMELRRFFGSDFPNRIARASIPLRPTEVRALAAAIDAESPQMVVAEYSALGPVLAALRTPGIIKAILLHDLFSIRAQTMRAGEMPIDFIDLTLADEVDWCRHADMLIYASQAEREVFSPHLPNATHHWLVPAREPIEPIAPSGQSRAFFMGVRHSGNLDALEFLMEEIWPHVITKIPDAELCIVGEIGHYLKSDWRGLPGVKVYGIVEDLAQFGGADTIGLAPTRLASGVSIKVAEYQRLGMAVLASEVAIKGYGPALEGSVLTASDAAEFVKILAELLTEPCQRHAIAKNSLATARAQTLIQDVVRSLQNQPEIRT